MDLRSSMIYRMGQERKFLELHSRLWPLKPGGWLTSRKAAPREGRGGHVQDVSNCPYSPNRSLTIWQKKQKSHLRRDQPIELSQVLLWCFDIRMNDCAGRQAWLIVTVTMIALSAASAGPAPYSISFNSPWALVPYFSFFFFLPWKGATLTWIEGAPFQ